MARLTSSPFFPGGPAAPRGPIGPFKQDTSEVMMRLCCTRVCLLVLNVSDVQE